MQLHKYSVCKGCVQLTRYNKIHYKWGCICGAFQRVSIRGGSVKLKKQLRLLVVVVVSVVSGENHLCILQPEN